MSWKQVRSEARARMLWNRKSRSSAQASIEPWGMKVYTLHRSKGGAIQVCLDRKAFYINQVEKSIAEAAHLTLDNFHGHRNKRGLSLETAWGLALLAAGWESAVLADDT